jgi:type I restriction enzyme R subunit
MAPGLRERGRGLRLLVLGASRLDLIEDFVDSVSATGEIDDEWSAYVAARREAELNEIIEAENLHPEETRAFIDAAFRDGAIQTTGTAITKVLPPVSRFSPSGGHGDMKQRVLTKLSAFFGRFFGLNTSGGSDG